MERITIACQDFTHYPLLLTIPGFGPYTSAIVLARIGEPERLPGVSKYYVWPVWI